MTRNNDISTFKLEDFVLPDSSDLEKSILTGAIFDAQALEEAVRLLKGDVFAGTESKDIWNTIVAMYKNHDEVSPITIAQKTKHRQFLVELTNRYYGTAPLTAISMASSCSMLQMAVLRRQCYYSAIDLLNKCSSPSYSSDDLLAVPEKLSKMMLDSIPQDNNVFAVGDVVNKLADKLNEIEIKRKQGIAVRVPTGFDTLNTLTYSGFTGGDLIILAARPSVGKTAIMLQMAKAATNAGFPALIFSLEMTNIQLAQRLMFSTDLVTPYEFANGPVNWDNFDNAASILQSSKMYFCDRARSIDDIASTILLQKQANKCGIVFIDYLTLMRLNPQLQRVQAVGEVTRRLKEIAKDCDIPVVLLSQLNRVSAAENRSPELYDLRESGDIEQDADIVLMAEKPTKTSLEEHLPGRTDLTPDNSRFIWVRKNRQYKAGAICIPVLANNSFTAFTEISKEQESVKSINPFDYMPNEIEDEPPF